MNTNKQGRDPIYPESLKLAVAREYLTGNLGFGKLAKKYNLAGADVVKYFVKWYRKRHADSVEPVLLEGKSGQEGPDKEARLEKQLREANLKITALQMLIEIAQKELGIDIVKKPGTKRSRK